MCTHLCLELRGWSDFSNVRANETVYTYCVSMYSLERCRTNITFEFGLLILLQSLPVFVVFGHV